MNKTGKKMPNNQPKTPPKATFNNKVSVTPPANEHQELKRAVREVASLEGNQILGNSGSQARNTRARFAAAPAFALVTNCQADAHQWKHKKYNPTPTNLELDACHEAISDKGVSSVLSTPFPKDRNFPVTSWMNVCSVLFRGGDCGSSSNIWSSFPYFFWAQGKSKYCLCLGYSCKNYFNAFSTYPGIAESTFLPW